MEPGRWARITDIYHATIARPREERASFIGQECHGDESLRKQVDAMVKSHERSGDFIESPAFAIAPELLIDEQMFDLIGQSVGHYQIESLLGVGGMGEVYLARDERLGRKAALKLLPDSLTADETQLSRFKNEARSASALNHPNILTVYEIGAEGNRQFIATEFIEGITLRASLACGRMNLRAALEIAVQVASALAAAHETGVVHRDIKPENIMLRPDGYAKVLDFGIAKLTEQRPASDYYELGGPAVLQTQPGLVLGTGHYMSPEQARGQKVDARSDIWSLGVVIYEMVGGSPPFRGETPSDCIASILTMEPPPLSAVLPDVPLKLESILQKALRKNSDERYQTIKEMLADLRNLKGELEAEGSSPQTKARAESIVSKIKHHKRGLLLTLAAALLAAAAVAYSLFFVAPAPLPNEKSIAVLPFENLSEEKSNAYFAEGVQDEILTRLAKIGALKVISRNSTQQYAARPGNLSEIAPQLGVVNILEGSVQKAGDQVHINVQLIRAATDEHLWAESYNRKLENIFGVEGEVATAVAEALKAKLTGAEQQALEQKPTNNAEAYDAYLRGLAYSLRPEYFEADNLNAIKYFSDAVKLDPKFALAWAWLAHANALGYFNKIGADFRGLREAAKHAAETAIKLQPDLGEAYLAQGYSQYYGNRDYAGAILSFEKAGKLSPGNSRVPEALALVCRRLGEWQRSLDYFRQATQLDPRDAALLSSEAETFFMLRQYPSALKVCDQILDILPDNSTALAIKVQVYQAQGNLAAAAALLAGLSGLPSHADQKLFLVQTNQWAYERRYAEGIAALQAAAARPDLATTEYDKIFIESNLAWFQQLAGEAAAARSTWQHVRTGIEALRGNKGEDLAFLELASANIALGDTATAFAIAERAAAIFSKDAMATAGVLVRRAKIAVQAGERDLAIQQLAISAQDPIGVSYGDLKLNPLWDPLRGDPRFEKIVASLAPKQTGK
jgi:serine/threonine protein kinase/Tfp pilus assembly protein PilF